MDPEVLGPKLKSYGLQLASGWFPGNLRECSIDQEFENLQEMQPYLDRAVDPAVAPSYGVAGDP